MSWPRARACACASVLPQFVEAYAGGVFTILRRAHGEVPMVQVVLPDERGRWPDEQGENPSPLGHQPLLARDPAWQTPIVHDAQVDLFRDPHAEPAEPLLAVPVLTSAGAEGRFELLRVHALDEHRAVIAEVPWLADHVAVDAVVQVLPAVGLPGCDGVIGQMGAMLAEGVATRAFRLPEAETESLGDALWAWHARDDTVVSTTLTTLHVNTAVPDAFDRAVRPFLRDGVLVPRALHSSVDALLLPSVEDCPDCG
jgi:hypothetical protein